MVRIGLTAGQLESVWQVGVPFVRGNGAAVEIAQVDDTIAFLAGKTFLKTAQTTSDQPIPASTADCYC
jgi:hypothetical protein